MITKCIHSPGLFGQRREERGFVNTMNFGLVKTLAVYLCLVEFSDLPCKSVMTFCGHVNRRSIGSFRAGENCTDK